MKKVKLEASKKKKQIQTTLNIQKIEVNRAGVDQGSDENSSISSSIKSMVEER